MKVLKVAGAIVAVLGVVVLAGVWWLLEEFAPSDIQLPKPTHILAYEERLTVETPLGRLTGRGNGEVHAFLGIRYAEPPTGERRFRAPVAVRPWNDTFDATAFPMVCTQTAGGLEGNTASQISEDCLFLSVFTPSTEGAHRPVLVWIHGGSFTGGAANGYDGSV